MLLLGRRWSICTKWTPIRSLQTTADLVYSGQPAITTLVPLRTDSIPASSFKRRIRRLNPASARRGTVSPPLSDIESIQTAYRAPLPTLLPPLDNEHLELEIFNPSRLPAQSSPGGRAEFSYRKAYGRDRLKFLGMR